MRIVAGRFRGRSLRAPRGRGTRPTSDKVREALFSTLFDLEDFEVLDLFAGSGAIGLEALSRGARRATFVERDRQALRALETNIETLGLSPDEAVVMGTSAASALRNLAAEGACFDLIFADPPYREASVVLPEVATLAGQLLSTHGRLVVEHATRDSSRDSTRDSVSPLSDIPGLACTSRRRYGDTTLSYYAREEPHGGEVPSRSQGTPRERPHPRPRPLFSHFVHHPRPDRTESPRRRGVLTMRLTQRLGGVAPSATLTLNQKAKDMKAQGKDVVALTAGEPDFATAKHIVASIERSLERGDTRYVAVSGIDELRKAIRLQYQEAGLDYGPAEVVVSTGAKQALFNAVLCLIERGDEAIVIAPYWLSYADMVRLAEGEVVTISTGESSGFLATPEQLEQAITPRTRLLFLNSPSNPAGAVYGRKELEGLAAVLRRHPEVVIVSDEIYDRFVYEGAECPSILAVAPDLKARTLIVNGCSKTYAMTGLRLGWAVGPKDLIDAMSTLQGQSTSNACTPIQYGAVDALVGDQSVVKTMIEAFDQRRRFVVDRLRAIPGVSCFDPKGAFYAFPNLESFVGKRLPDGRVAKDADTIAEHLVESQSLVVIPGGPFGAPNHVRLSFATDMRTLEKGLERLERGLAELR